MVSDVIPVSIIIPNFNSGKFLYKCIESINSGQSPAEIIIVDDVSTDESLAIALELANRYANVQVIRRTTNGGAAAARRQGLDIARSEWVAFVDADDYLEDSAIKVAYETVTTTGADICIWQLWRQSVNREWCMVPLDEIAFPVNGRAATMLTLDGWKIHPLGVTRKRLYLEAYNAFAEDCAYADELLSRLVFTRATSIMACQKRYYYRENLASTSQALHPRRLTVLDAHLWLIRFCKEHAIPMSDPIVRKSINDMWFLFAKRKEIGVRITKDKIRAFIAQLLLTGEVSARLALYPKLIVKLLLITLFVRIPGL